jgi:hypothetical protein
MTSNEEKKQGKKNKVAPTVEVKTSEPNPESETVIGAEPLSNADTLAYLQSNGNDNLFYGTEKEFERCIVANVEVLLACLNITPVLIQTQKRLSFNVRAVADLFIQDKDGSIHLFEIKKSNTKYPWTTAYNQCAGIGQLLLYGSIVDVIYGIKPKLYLIDDKIEFRTVAVFGSHALPITLLEFRKDRLVVIKPMKNNHQESEICR